MSDKAAKHLPLVFHTEMDGGTFMKSLEHHEAGATVQHEGMGYRVLYSWEWIRVAGTPVYCAELQPLTAYTNDSRLKEVPHRD